MSSTFIDNPILPARLNARSWVLRGVKTALAVLVIYATAKHVGRTWTDLQSKGDVVRIAGGPIAASLALYLAGLSAYGLYFCRVLNASLTPISRYAGIRAYLISHLGKYVPGKAMVVVMRVGLTTPHSARPATTAFASLYETLLMMSAGGLLSALAFGSTIAVAIPLPFLSGRSVDLPMAFAGLGLGVIFAIVVAPPVFPRLASLARMPFPGVGPDALPRFTWRLWGEGFLYCTVGWMLLGLSQVAVLSAILPAGLPTSAWPTAIACVALATVVGFVVPISPGGLGVREWVLWTSLTAVIDRDHAVVAALVLRLAWVAGELLAALILVAIRPSRPGSEPRAEAQ